MSQRCAIETVWEWEDPQKEEPELWAEEMVP